MSAVAPFIRPVQVQGGTFFTMSSASEDLSFTFNNDGRQFKFSKYTLLNIPDIKRPVNGPLNYENFIQFDGIEKEKVIDYVSKAKRLLESYGVRVELEGRPMA